MAYLSKEEAQCVYDAYKDQGYISVIREKSKGYICEIPTELNTWDKRRVSAGDLLYHFDNPNTCLELLSIEPIGECTSFKITVKCGDEEKPMVVDDFFEFKTSPWSKKDRVKMVAIRAVVALVAVLAVVALFCGLVYLLWSDTVTNLLISSDATSEAAQELDKLMLQAWSLIRCAITGTVVYSVISVALKHLKR